MRIILDTNVFISATFWNGDSSKIIKKIEKGEFDLVLSKDILLEYSQVLDYKEIKEKARNKNLNSKYPVNKIAALSKIVEPKVKFSVIDGDPDDNKFIEAALEGKCSYIISQDKHLLELKSFRGIKIVSPSDFLTLPKVQKDKK